MKQLAKLSIVLVMLMAGWACYAQNNQKQPAKASDQKVEAYYFHFTSRCVTCKAVEAEAKKNIETLYGGKVTFQSVNLDDASSKPLADKLKVSGQTLLVVKGDRQVNLTNDGFLYARNNPEKFKAVIKDKVDPLM